MFCPIFARGVLSRLSAASPAHRPLPSVGAVAILGYPDLYLREPQQMYARFKLSAGSQRRDEQDPINADVIVGPAGAYQARKASQVPSI